MSDEKKTYLHDCPDCIPLPAQFPHSCLGPVMAALRGTVEDPQCVVHCGYTLVGWGLGLWLVDHNPHVFGAADVPAEGAREWAAEQLASLSAKGTGGTVPEDAAMALPWKTIALIILDLVRELLNKV